jgi:hypothetical protein
MSEFKISRRNVHSDNRSSIIEKHDSKIKEYQEKIKKNKKTNNENLKDEMELNKYLFNLMDFLNEEEIEDQKIKKDKDEGIHKFISLNSEINNGTIYEKYMEKCHGVKKYRSCDNSFICSICGSSMINSVSEGLTICYTCGTTDKLNLSTTPEWNSFENYDFIKPFSYKRSNHFKEWINQIQGREGTNIPNDTIQLLLLELKKERIYNKKLITYEKIKGYLKKLKLNKYYEHIPNIIHKITGNRRLIISTELEKTLINMFDEIQQPFEKHCPKNRRNFLSYSYTLYKFFQILDMNEYLIYFPLLKSREKMFEQEEIWKNICKEVGWKFIRCI